MTLPINITLPLDVFLIKSEDPDALYQYMKKLVYVLGTQIQETNQVVNVTLTVKDNQSYPFIIGSIAEGTAIFTNSVLWTRRSNLFTQGWFDITWSGHTGTGNLLIQVPYFSQPSAQFPYVGTIEPNGITFGAGYTYLTANILPETNTIEIHQCGSGMVVTPLALPASGSLRGSIMYVGQQFQ